MVWKIITASSFSKSFQKYKRDKEVTRVLDKKLERLKEDPLSVGGWLAGQLSGHKSTRITRKLRLVFYPENKTKSVFLIGLDHRKFNYERF
ncbi:type II toxin-antitoxin system RelE/ParE family toxin [Nanoarchaeota archaeon]